MPKAKPTQVIVHRIELQEKERDALEAYIAGNTVKNVVIPTAAIAGVGAAGYLGYKALKEAYDWGEDVIDKAKDSFDEFNRDPKTMGLKEGIKVTPIGKFFEVGKWFFS